MRAIALVFYSHPASHGNGAQAVASVPDRRPECSRAQQWMLGSKQPLAFCPARAGQSEPLFQAE
jgi:hypothetical protein